MTVAELANVCKSQLKVMSAYNGRVFCHDFNKDKHGKYADREVLSVWADMCITDSGFRRYALPIMCVYVSDIETFERENSAK